MTATSSEKQTALKWVDANQKRLSDFHLVEGSKWVAPLLPPDFVPPVDLRWPEYVTTPRGEAWWIPTPHPGPG